MPKKKEVVYIEDVKAGCLRANIEAHQRKMGITDIDMARVLGINAIVFRRKVLSPHLFKYNELISVFRILKFNQDEILESI